jgi:hypothetical protein
MRSVAVAPVVNSCPVAPVARAPPARAPCHARLHHTRASHVAAAVKVDATPASAPLEALRFLSPPDVEAVRTRFGTPAYVYDLETLKEQVRMLAAAHTELACGCEEQAVAAWRVTPPAATVHQANSALAFPNAFGLTVNYAMKASPNAAILKVRG